MIYRLNIILNWITRIRFGSVILLGMFLCLLLCNCGGGESGAQNKLLEKTDSTIYISGYVAPVNYRTSTIGSHNYSAWILIDDYSNGNPAHISDAIVTVNGETAGYNTTSGYYELPSISGSFSAGSTINVTIIHPRAALTKTLTVPATSVPTEFTFNPLFDNTAGKTVQNVTYTVTPTSSWTNYGCIVAYLYGTGTAASQASHYYSSISTGAQFTSTQLSLGTPAALSQNIMFGAWNMDKVDLTGFYTLTPSRLRIYAPSGSIIAQNF